MGTSDFYQFIEWAKPLIEQAAENAKRRAQRVILNTHMLYEVYIQERNRLHYAAWGFKENETVKPDRHTPEMNREEFETYLLNHAVWVETEGPEGSVKS